MFRKCQKYLYWQMSFSQGFVWVDWMKKCMRKWYKRDLICLEIAPIVLTYLPIAPIVLPILKFGDSLPKNNTLAISRAFWYLRSPVKFKCLIFLRNRCLPMTGLLLFIALIYCRPCFSSFMMMKKSCLKKWYSWEVEMFANEFLLPWFTVKWILCLQLHIKGECWNHTTYS